MLKYKKELMERKIRKFNDNNWFEWGGLRNISFVESNLGKPCIYVRNMSRKNIIAVKSTVQYFGPGLFMLLPKNKSINLDKIVNHINSSTFRNNFTYSSRFKINHFQLYRHAIIL